MNDSESTAIGHAGRLLFVATILTGSFLLFLVQPMVARMALPRLGGAPEPAPPPSISEQQQIQDDAEATGMTARLDQSVEGSNSTD